MRQTEKQKEWNDSYDRGGNICFYPNEEIVRFINRYVRKRTGISDFHNIMELTSEEWTNFRSLDLGCGMGRHIKFLDEFGLNPSGIDLSDKAIAMGKDWFKRLNREDLANRLTVGSVTELPYEDETFQLCIACSSLDSMHRDIARKGIAEAFRVMKRNGLMWLDLIMHPKNKDTDEIVEEGYEKDTVQSYFTCDSIRQYLGDKVETIRFEIITKSDWQQNVVDARAYLVVKKL